MNITFEIELGSPAFLALQQALADPGTYRLRLADDGGFKLKVNEQTWSPPLATHAAATRATRPTTFDIEPWVSGYDGDTFAMSPDAPQDWADGFRDAHCHVLGHDRDYAGSWLDTMVPDYRDGYRAAIDAIRKAGV